MVKVRLFKAGCCLHPDYMVTSRMSRKVRRFPMQCALLQHPQHGNILFDTGYNKNFFIATQHWPYSLYSRITPVVLRRTLAEQLSAAGIDPLSIRCIMLSHLHADHMCSVDDFPNAVILLSREAYAASRELSGLRGLRRGILPQLMNLLNYRELLFFEDAGEDQPVLNTGLQGVDIFGDGSMLACPLPGHACGHYGLFLPKTDGEPLFLVGDAVWTQETLRGQHRPHRLTALVQHDFATYRKTQQLLQQLVQRFPHVRFISSHGPVSLNVPLYE